MADIIDVEGLDELVRTLADRGYTVLGPTVRDRTIVIGEISSVDDLPTGITADQEPGTYRLRSRDDDALFGYAAGPSSWKEYLFPARELLWRADREAFTLEPPPEPPRYAFLGARACDLAAIAVQDRIFTGGVAPDPNYTARRENAFIVAVNCGSPSGTCFCVSMDTGPEARDGYDIVLTELLDDVGHRFLAEPGSEAGADVLAALPRTPPTEDDEAAARRVVAEAAERMGRTLDTDGIKELLYENLDHPRWDDVASRCLGCANCTLVCPTCFCAHVEDITDLTGEHAERWRRWDSCFSLDHSAMHGGRVRTSTRSRYRQWMTHKLATWIDQFGTSGCVGCGRCITWCPVGIDITEEAGAIRAANPRGAA